MKKVYGSHCKNCGHPQTCHQKGSMCNRKAAIDDERSMVCKAYAPKNNLEYLEMAYDRSKHGKKQSTKKRTATHKNA